MTDTDIINFCYKEKGDKIFPKAYGINPTPFNNFPMKVYVENNYLILADLENKYSLPLDSIEAIKKINKKIIITNWNKDLPFDDNKYKEFILGANNIGLITLKDYYVLELNINGEVWGIYFPSYELEYFESITGFKAI